MSDLLISLLSALVGSLVGGGGVLGFLAWRGDTVRKDLDRANERHERCERKVELLEARLGAVENAQDPHLARWVKDAGKRIAWMNDKAFLTIFAPLGISREQADGKTFDELLLDRTAARELDRLDRLALLHEGTPVSNLIQLHPDLPLMHIVKVASTGKLGELCFQGYAFRVNDRDLADAGAARRQGDQRGESLDRLAEGK